MSGEATCWTEIREAADGDGGARAAFAERYESVLRAYFGARWRSSPLRASVDDALQEVFVECLKDGGLLESADPSRPGGFRAFLYGAALRVARRHEEGRGGARELRLPSLFEVEDGEAHLTRVFDAEWARAMLREAARRQRVRAEALEDPDRRERALGRVALLQDRFQRGLPVREIARERAVPAKQVQDDYARAREEFRAALIETVRFHAPSGSDPEARAAELVGLLGAS